MLRSAASKVMWVGRATVFLVGLAVILALVLGVATSAMGANGQNFILGKLNNAATKVTGLVGNVDGAAALRVTNPNAGTNDTALDLRVQAGEAPMKVNSKARVANLNAATAGRADSAASADNATNAGNADTVDGKHAAEFAAKAEASGFDAQTVTTSTILSTTTKDIATITVTAPADGFVILTGNGVFVPDHTNGQLSILRAFLTKTSGSQVFENMTFQRITTSSPSGIYAAPFSITRVFPVTAGEHTFYMTANLHSGSAGEIDSRNLTGIFVKNQF